MWLYTAFRLPFLFNDSSTPSSLSTPRHLPEIEIGDKKYTFTYDRTQDAILYDGNYIFKRQSDIAEDDNNAEVRIDAVSSEFLGKWKAVNIENTKGEISVYPDVLKTTTVILEITENKTDKVSATESNAGSKLSMDLKIHGDTDKSTISGISSTFTMGAITFQIANPIESSIIETGKRSDGKVFLLEDLYASTISGGLAAEAAIREHPPIAAMLAIAKLFLTIISCL